MDSVADNSSLRDTLLVITADHETGYLLGPGHGQRPIQSDKCNRRRRCEKQ